MFRLVQIFSGTWPERAVMRSNQQRNGGMGDSEGGSGRRRGSGEGSVGKGFSPAMYYCMKQLF